MVRFDKICLHILPLVTGLWYLGFVHYYRSLKSLQIKVEQNTQLQGTLYKFKSGNIEMNQRSPKTGPYQKVNAYSQRPALQQIIAVAVFVVVLILHSIFIVPPIVAVIKHAILIFFLGLHYVLILLIAYDYIYLTVVDPVDSLVGGSAQEAFQKPQQLKRCVICNKNVFLKSYHCMRCNRCTQNFDHHCKYLNNCVGGTNYQNFFRILITLTVYFLNLMSQCIWVFVVSYTSQDLQNYMISRWPVLIIGICVVILILGVDSLLLYHIYLTLIRQMTTLEYIFRQTPSNDSNSTSERPSTNPQSQNNLHRERGGV